jgi:Uma2 family endonuclease
MTTWEIDESRQITLAEYESLVEPDEWISEVSRGWLVREPRPNVYHSLVAGNVFRQLNAFVEEHALGLVLMESGFKLSDVPLTIRGPDVAFIRQERLPSPLPRRGFPVLVPDLAIEVVSPSNTVAKLQRKILDFFEGGVVQVWIIDPFSELATVYRSLSDIAMVKSPNAIIAGDLLPGFQLELAALFQG